MISNPPPLALASRSGPQTDTALAVAARVLLTKIGIVFY